MTYSAAGTVKAELNPSGLELAGGSYVGWSSALTGVAPDVTLYRDAANTLAQRNSTNAQAFRIYNTYTDASNYERGFARWASNVFEIGTEGLGTGTDDRTLRLMRGSNSQITLSNTSGTTVQYSASNSIVVGNSITFTTGGSSRWAVNSSGHLLASSDNVLDIGASGATRPRTGYFAFSLESPRFYGGDFRAGTSGYIYWNGSTTMTAPSNGVLKLSNSAETDFSRLQFGGTSSSFPAIKRNGAGLDVRLADDSGYAPLTASMLTSASSIVAGSGSTISVGNTALSTSYVENISSGWSLTSGAIKLGSTGIFAWTSAAANGTSDTALARAAAKVVSITDASTGGGTLRVIPDSPAQITADQNNYQADTGRSMFYRLSSDASRSITGFNPAGGTNQDGELHYFINVGSNNIVLVNESASSTAGNRFTNVTGADITLAANEMAMLIYDNTSTRWRVAKM